ncbi:MAG: TerC family protein [Plesiomonas sp.]|uniref:TerC family protein n=1 Tax=Plesiomonas sp. TaxID=2486279 RepID=UPI003F3EE751
MELLVDPNAWIALLTLTALEIVLGIDNIIFLSILVGRLPEHQRQKGRILGLGLAMGTRILLLISLTWLMRLTEPMFTVATHAVSGRDLILFFGGLFLIAKSTHEIHESLQQHHNDDQVVNATRTSGHFLLTLVQIAILDIVFSLDSVITAVGLVSDLPIMILAIIIAVLIMMLAAKSIGDFVDNNPTIKMLALAFLILVGFTLLGESVDIHIPKGYIYFAMGFSFGVEMLNIRLQRGKSIKLNKNIPD